MFSSLPAIQISASWLLMLAHAWLAKLVTFMIQIDDHVASSPMVAVWEMRTTLHLQNPVRGTALILPAGLVMNLSQRGQIVSLRYGTHHQTGQ